MGSKFDIIYPSKGRIGFDGGLNNKFDVQLIPDNESPDCQNVVFGRGSVETRGGTDLVNTAAVGSFACDGLYVRHDSDASETMTAWFGGTLYDLQGTSFITIPSAQSIFTPGVRVSAAEYEDYIFYGNGTESPYKYNGAEFTRHGVPAPTTTSTVATAATGTELTGDYQYKFTYINSNLVEGDVSPVTSTWTAATENALLTSIPVAPQSFGVNTRKIYRTEASGTAFKLVTTIDDNTTTTYEDGIADGALGATAPTDQGEPPNYCCVLFHQARLFMIDNATNFIKYTEIANPYVVKATSFRRIGDTSGDIPKGLAVYDNSVVVFCQNSTWIIYMPTTSPSDWSDIKVRTPFGSNSPFAPFMYSNKVMFAATQSEKFVGFAALSGDTVDPNATLLTVSAAGSFLKSDKIEPDMFNIQESFLRNISSMVYQNKAYITVTYASGSIINNRIYVFDFSIENLGKPQKFTWSPWTGLSAAQMAVLDGTLYYATSDDDGFMYAMNSDTFNDNNTAINSYYWTKEFSGNNGQDTFEKDFRSTNILYEQPGAYFMNFTQKVDSDKGDGNTTVIDLDPGSNLWGTIRLGTDPWGGGENEKELKKFLGTVHGKRIQFKFDNQNKVDQKFKILGLNITYNLKGRR